MKQKYFYILIFFCFMLYVAPAEAQNNKEQTQTETKIEGLSIYPNPASADKIYIETKKQLSKKIEIYNVLGKKIYSEIISGREINISFLTSGVYMLKIEEGGKTATRKLLVK